MKRLLIFTLASGMLALLSVPVAAQSYPSGTVRVVVPYPPGGSVDYCARIIVQMLNESLGQHFIVENRAGGAGGMVGANYVAKAAPDGNTLLLTASIHVITPFLHKDVPYDVVKDFTPITLIADGPLLVSTPTTTPADNLKDFFKLVHKEPGKYTFATSGFGSAGHLAIEMLKRDAGVDTLVVAYKGAGPALTDLMSGQVQLMADPMLSSLPLVRGGKLKALAITSKKRIETAPDIPTVAESGMDGFELVSWYGLWAPKDLPSSIGAKLQEEIAKIVARPDVKDRLAALGFEPIGSTSEHFATFIVDEMAKSARIIEDAKIKMEP
jgi:tripartite-type tricarboxylate transporter receptor subunit TctC